MLSKYSIKFPSVIKNIKFISQQNLRFNPVTCRRLTTSSSFQNKGDSREPYVIPSIYSDVQIPNVNLPQYLFDAQEKHAGRIGLVNGETGQSFTHADTRSRCHILASALCRLGISQGEKVALISHNCPEFVISYVAVMLMGGSISTFNHSYTASEIEFQLGNSDSVAIICHSNKLRDVLEATKNNKAIRHIIAIDFSDNIKDIISFNELMKDDGRGIPNNIQISPDDVASIPYSSGTTGLPKGVMLTHRNLVSNLEQVMHPQVLPTRLSDENHQEKYLGLLPLYHIYGMMGCMFLCFMTGSRMTTLKEFNGDTYIEAIRMHELSVLHLVPPLMSFLESSAKASPDLLKNVQTVVCGAAPVGGSLLESFFNKFGNHIEFFEGYGMTEASPTTHISKKGDYILGSCGPAIPNTLTKIRDIHTNRYLKPEEGEGEICIKGPQVMKGYYKNEKSTLETVQDGWLHTGDIGRMDSQCNVFIVDRLKELIKVKGFQVAPAELENVLRLHEAVNDVAVIGVPDDKAGELPKAFIVTENGSKLTEEQIKSFVASKVSEYKKLGYVQFVKEIPKSAAGKILRKELKNL